MKQLVQSKSNKIYQNSDSEREFVLEKADIALNLTDSFKHPETYEDAYYHPNFEERMKLREAILKEFNQMKDKGVYDMILKSELPNGHTCIKNNWVFKIKRNGIFRVRLVACGYSQVLVVDLKEVLPRD
jgi:hypothetical protein